MELRHLRYFTAVARTLNFSMAARVLNIAQPPLSRQIRDLEQEIGATLFDRGTRPMQLTAAGRFLHEQAEQILARIDEVVVGTRRLAEGERGWFGVGFVPTTLYTLLPDLLRRFRLACPEVDIGLSELTTLQQIDALRAGRIDIGFGRLQLGAADIACEVILDETLAVILPAGHPMGALPEIGLADVQRLPLIVYPARPRPSYADQVIEVFKSRGLMPTIAFEVNEMQTAVGLVASGAGVTLVPMSARPLVRDDVVHVPLAERDATSPIVMNYRVGDASPLLDTFRRMLDAAGLPVREVAQGGSAKAPASGNT